VTSKRLIGKVLRITVGILLLLVGIAGLVLPVLQGLLTILLGLVVLSYDVPFVHRRLERLKARFPRQAKLLHKAEAGLAARWKKFAAFFSRKRRAASSPTPCPPVKGVKKEPAG